MRFILLLLFFLSVSYADTFKIAGTFLSMNYVETDENNNFLDSETSDFDAIIGLNIAYVMVVGSGLGGSNQSSLGLSVDYSNGKTDYDGALQSTTTGAQTPFKTTSNMTIIEPKLRWSETKRSKSYDNTIFTSIAYRYWQRDLGSQYGYKEEYSWLYADIGLKMLFHDVDWHIGFEAAYQIAYQPQMHAAINGGLDFDLGNTDGYYFEIPLSYDINENYAIEIAYKANYWNIEASNVVKGYIEPQSKTENQKINIGLVITW